MLDVDEPHYIRASIIRARPDTAKAEPLFLYYFFNSTAGLHCSIPSVVRWQWRESREAICPRLEIPAPPLCEQRVIAHILGTLDDKIELNRRMNETLGAMARAIFKSWFADFDPVRAAVADLIRDRLLEIGDGYRAKNSELGNSGLPFIRAGDLNNGFDTAGAELLTEDSVAKVGSKVCRVGDVAFTSKGTIGRFARVTEHTAKFVYSPQVCYWRSLDPVQFASGVALLLDAK